MIPWVKYDPENPPELPINKVYLVTNGKRYAVARIDHGGWFTADGYIHHTITHYSELYPPESEGEK